MIIRPEGREIKFTVTATPASGFGGQAHHSALRMDTMTYGLPMLVALILVTAAESFRARLRALGLGILIMLLLTIPVVMMSAKITSLELEDMITQANFAAGGKRSGFFNLAFHGYSFAQPVFAVLIWLSFVMLGLFKKRVREEVEESKIVITRNAPCPCGSGRKYKRCCGRA